MIKVTETPEKMTAPKKTITVKGIDIETLHLEDESGDITEQFVSLLPEDMETLDFKIVIEQ